MLRSGNATQIWANEFYFKGLGLRLIEKRAQFCRQCAPAVLLEVSGNLDYLKG